MKNVDETNLDVAERPTLLVVDPGTADMDLLIAVMLLAGVRKAGVLNPDGTFVAMM